jgi:hypothetical protein
MTGGQQQIGIQSWNRKWVMVHELFHALGMWHEQSRADRDDFVQINWEAIESGFAPQFAIAESGNLSGPYDFDSVMHYNQFAFSTGSRTITVLPPYRKRWQYRIGIRERDSMGSGDIRVLTELYGGDPPPSVFDLTWPENGEEVGASWIPTFTWQPAEQAQDYRLIVDDDPSFVSPELDITTATSFYDHGQPLAPDRLFYWTVEARNAVGTSRPFVDRAFYTAPSAPRTLFVDDDAPPDGTGASWDDAFRDLQDALAVASNIPFAVTEIRIAQGTYRPDRETGNREMTFDLPSDVRLLGGYAGLGTPAPDDRDPDKYATILTGDLNGDDGTGGTRTTDNSYRVVFALALEGTTVLDGVTVTGGNATGTGANLSFAGLLIDDGSLTVRGCVFEGNRSDDVGGGLAIAYGARVTVTDCKFLHNEARTGAGVASVAADEAVVSSSVFKDNTATGSGAGGAIYSLQTDPWVINSAFMRNEAETGGAIFGMDGANPVIVNSAFHENAATTGGAIFVDDNGLARLTNSILWNNEGLDVAGPATAEYNCLENAIAGIGNISTDPLFRNAAVDDLRLSPGSPCIDSGYNRAVPYDVTTDLSGRARFVDDPDSVDCPVPGADCGRAPIVDMGPHEFAPLMAGDLNDDSKLDLADHAIFTSCLGNPDDPTPPAGCSLFEFNAADLEGDRDVDVRDFAAFEQLPIVGW